VEPVAKVIILHGDDEVEIQGFLEAELNNLGSPDMIPMNLSRLDGNQVRLEEITVAACTVPFLSSRRIVILDDPLARLSTQDSQEQFQTLLDNLPATTTMVLVIEDHQTYKNRQNIWEKLGEKHWLRIWASKTKKAEAKIIPYPRPSIHSMPAWIQQKARSLNGDFDPRAASTLATHVENNTLLAAQEVEKLLIFVNWERPVRLEDVELLTAARGAAGIFDMVDAIGKGESSTALGLFHRLLEEHDPGYIFSMIIRQFRLILQVREALDGNTKPSQNQLISSLKPYQTQKLIPQAQRFSLSQLESIYQKLLQIDIDLKTGRCSLETALDCLVIELGYH
jgi:DNA polymerase-3 subunit delta